MALGRSSGEVVIIPLAPSAFPGAQYGTQHTGNDRTIIGAVPRLTPSSIPRPWGRGVGGGVQAQILPIFGGLVSSLRINPQPRKSWNPSLLV